jgi:ATP-dependent Clp protease ATP-binding subunit ClpA
MTDELAPLSDLCRRAHGDDGAPDGLHAIVALRSRLEELERRHVAEMLDHDATWAEVAEALGISRQAAHRRFRHAVASRTPERSSTEVRRVLVTGEARGTVRLAREEAAAQGARAVGTEHLLLALARTAPEPLARALRDAGIDEHALRSMMQPTIVEDGTPAAAGGGFTRHAREVLEGSLREAVERGDGFIAADHLMLALLRNPAGGAAQTLEALGVEPGAVFATLSDPR